MSSGYDTIPESMNAYYAKILDRAWGFVDSNPAFDNLDPESRFEVINAIATFINTSEAELVKQPDGAFSVAYFRLEEPYIGDQAMVHISSKEQNEVRSSLQLWETSQLDEYQAEIDAA